MGEKVDQSGGQAMPAGTYFCMPAGMKHFAWTTGETVVQLSGLGSPEHRLLEPGGRPSEQPKEIVALISERTRLGVQQAIASGRRVGRPPALDPEQRKLLIELIQSGQKTQAEMARLLKVNRSVISRMIAKERGDRYPGKGPHAD
jgi:hypothetical protein